MGDFKEDDKWWCRNKLNRLLAWVLPADSFATAIGVGIGIGIGIELTKPDIRQAPR
ncbi:MAG: hypothetical protein N838_19005 [Thiohalocapsa sp. PB-PSB1]|jgi:hypothetical protein|nr:MAG: hypothetical protein N838_19005 [Thiohalocapsa sp. PB-PSB1]